MSAPRAASPASPPPWATPPSGSPPSPPPTPSPQSSLPSITPLHHSPPSPAPPPSPPSSLPNHLSITSSLLTNLTHHINCLSFRIICHAVECLRRHVGTVHTMNTMLPYSATADTFSQHRINNLLLSFPLPPFCHFGSGLSSPYPFNFHHVPTWLMSAVSLNPSFVLPGSDLPARSL